LGRNFKKKGGKEEARQNKKKKTERGGGLEEGKPSRGRHSGVSRFFACFETALYPLKEKGKAIARAREAIEKGG